MVQGDALFLGPGKEAFVDSWAVFYLASDPTTRESPGTAFSLMVKSRQTIVDGVTRDCKEQLKMCEEAVQSHFHLLVISDGIHILVCFVTTLIIL